MGELKKIQEGSKEDELDHLIRKNNIQKKIMEKMMEEISKGKNKGSQKTK